MKKIIIDTDIGIDDAFALYYATKLFDVIGITTVSGNCTVEMATKNAKLFCQKNNVNIPVYKGADHALVLPQTPPICEVHGNDGMGDAYENPFDAKAPNAVEYLINTIMQNKGEITVCAIGPLTNIAIALNLCPEIKENIKELVIMGGAFGTKGHTGNMSQFSEFNIWKDPHAADQVFKSNMPITIIPLDVTYEVLVSGEEIAKTNNKFLDDISKVYLEFSQNTEGYYGFAVHDALTIAYLYDSSFFNYKTEPVRVSVSDITMGQTLIPVSSMPVADPNFDNMPKHKIAVDVDVARVKDHFLKTISII